MKTQSNPPKIFLKKEWLMIPKQFVQRVCFMLKTCFLLRVWNSGLCEAEATNMTQEPKPKVRDNHAALGRKMGACLTCSGMSWKEEATGAAAEKAGRKGETWSERKEEGLTREGLAATAGALSFTPYDMGCAEGFWGEDLIHIFERIASAVVSKMAENRESKETSYGATAVIQVSNQTSC